MGCSASLRSMDDLVKRPGLESQLDCQPVLLRGRREMAGVVVGSPRMDKEVRLWSTVRDEQNALSR